MFKINKVGMRMVLACICLALLVAPLMSCAKEAPAPPTKDWNLKFSSPWVDEYFMTQIAHHFADLVTSRTNGQVKVVVFPAGQLGPTHAELEMCGQGVSDFGIPTTSHHVSQLPLTGGLNIPFAWPHGGRLAEGMWEELDPLLEPEFAANNVKFLWAVPMEYVVHAKSDFIKKLEDLKGKKANFTGGYANKCLATWGAGVVSIPGPEMYTALQRGTIDVNIVSPSVGVTYKHYEVAPYVTDLTMSASVYVAFMNLDLWNSLPEDLQQVIKECRDETVEWMGPIVDENVRAFNLHDAYKKVGAHLYIMPENERQRWMEAAQPVWEEYLDVAGPNAKNVYDIIIKYRGE